MTTRRTVSAALLSAPLLAAGAAHGQQPQPAPPVGKLFAIEFRTGPAWDASRKPHEQAQFREHSQNLKKLRDQGLLLLGARYADKGFVLLAAESEAAARALIDADPSVQQRVFAYEIHPFNVFYAGCVPAPARAPA